MCLYVHVSYSCWNKTLFNVYTCKVQGYHESKLIYKSKYVFEYHNVMSLFLITESSLKFKQVFYITQYCKVSPEFTQYFPLSYAILIKPGFGPTMVGNIKSYSCIDWKHNLNSYISWK